MLTTPVELDRVVVSTTPLEYNVELGFQLVQFLVQSLDASDDKELT